MIWPSSQRWPDLEKSLKINTVVVLMVYLAVATAGVLRPGPTRKDMVMFEWARAHVDLGLGVTKGYNISTKWLATTTPVYMGNHGVYVSAPPLYPLFFAGIYAACGQHWRSLRLAPLILGLVYLYSCLALSCKYLQGQARIWLMYFALSPMILIYSTDLEINVGTLGLAVLSYLCFTNYLETARMRWMFWTGQFYLLAFWNSYTAFSIVPPMLIQLCLHGGLPSRERRRALCVWLGFVGLGFAVVLAHLAFLPGALEGAMNRASVRYSATMSDPSHSPVSMYSFAIRQFVRMVTHYTPVCVLLAAASLVLAIRQMPRRPLGHGPDSPQPVSAWTVVVQFSAWGLLFGVVAVNLAYNHPYYIYYFAIFFAYGSALVLQWISERIPSTVNRRFVVHALLVVFFSMSVARSLFAISGGSLPTLLAGYLPGVIGSRFGPDDKGPRTIPRDQW